MVKERHHDLYYKNFLSSSLTKINFNKENEQ